MSDYGYVDVGKLADFANNTIGGLTANDIMRFPRADVQPIRRGRWIGDEVIQCSNCNFTLNGTSYGRIVHKYFSYCPFCGADMRELNE